MTTKSGSPHGHSHERQSDCLRPRGRPTVPSASPAKGAATSIYLASAPEVHGVTGSHYVNRKPRTSNNSSYDTAAAARLWQVSENLVGLIVTA